MSPIITTTIWELKIPIILALTFINIESIIARPQFPNLQPPGPPREPAPIHEPQAEDTLDVHGALFTAYNNANRQYFGANSLSHNLPAYSTSAVLAPSLFTPLKTISSPVSYSTNSNSYVRTYSTPIVSSGTGVLPTVIQNEAKSVLTYSEAPLVSHVTFTGAGSSYSW